MIPKIQACGASFAGLAAYLTHDPDAETAKRVAWTHTLNLAHDDVTSAVDEMLWTARAAELLKQEAGIRAGGRATENVVKHVSLNWSPEDPIPSREHVIETAEGFLQHMGWHEHQALLVAHDDKAYAHVHLEINAVHPETGLRLNEDFEQRRAQAWALQYEREQGHIRCEQRLENAAEREQGPTRPAWMAFKEKQREFERDEKSLREQEPILLPNVESPTLTPDAEWKKLKEIQRQERTDFFADGKSAFSEMRLSVYREVREEFRERWSDFYATQRAGGDATALADIKAMLLAEQKEALETRRDEAFKELRESRDGLYREMLGDQREARLGLRWRQEAGLDNALFLQTVEGRHVDRDPTAAFRDAASDITNPRLGPCDARDTDAFAYPGREETAGMKSGTDVSANVALGMGFAFASFFDFFADGLVHSNPGPRPEPPEPEPPRPDLFQQAADETRRASERQQADEEEQRRNQRGGYGE